MNVASAKDGWFVCEIDRKALKALMRRDDATGLLCFAGWLAGLLVAGWLAYLSLGTSWAIPAFMIYGVLYCFAEPIAHECSHGTPFRSRWLNESVYLFVGLLMFKERTFHRWMHARHHSHTIMTGQDPEIQLPRPTSGWAVLGELTGIRQARGFLTALFRNAAGALSETTKAWVPESEHRKLVSGARLYLVIYGAIITVAVALQLWSVFLFVFLPRLYGIWLKTALTFTQHAGLEDNVKATTWNTTCSRPSRSTPCPGCTSRSSSNARRPIPAFGRPFKKCSGPSSDSRPTRAIWSHPRCRRPESQVQPTAAVLIGFNGPVYRPYHVAAFRRGGKGTRLRIRLPALVTRLDQLREVPVDVGECADESVHMTDRHAGGPLGFRIEAIAAPFQDAGRFV